mgnify:CR=1 FL=1
MLLTRFSSSLCLITSATASATKKTQKLIQRFYMHEINNKVQCNDSVQIHRLTINIDRVLYLRVLDDLRTLVYTRHRLDPSLLLEVC